MQRPVVQVGKIRIMDAQIDDVVHYDGKKSKGWFKVVSREVLTNGDLQLSDSTTHITLVGGSFDLIGVQFVREVDVAGAAPVGQAQQAQHPEQVQEQEQVAPGEAAEQTAAAPGEAVEQTAPPAAQQTAAVAAQAAPVTAAQAAPVTAAQAAPLAAASSARPAQLS